MIVLLIYMIGLVLAYGRFVASYYDTYRHNKFMFNVAHEEFAQGLWISCLFSWVAFTLGTIVFFTENEETFLKFNLED